MKKLAWKDFYALCQMSQQEFQSLPLVLKADTPNYSAALEIEIARQLSDDGGMTLEAAGKVVTNTGAAGHCRVAEYATQKQNGMLYDYWIGIKRSRNTWGDAPRGSYPITGFGAGEYWSSTHFSGPLHRVQAEINYWIAHDENEYPDADAARIFLTNASAADRRLRKRAAELGIEIDG